MTAYKQCSWSNCKFSVSGFTNKNMVLSVRFSCDVLRILDNIRSLADVGLELSACDLVFKYMLYLVVDSDRLGSAHYFDRVEVQRNYLASREKYVTNQTINKRGAENGVDGKDQSYAKPSMDV